MTYGFFIIILISILFLAKSGTASKQCDLQIKWKIECVNVTILFGGGFVISFNPLHCVKSIIGKYDNV